MHRKKTVRFILLFFVFVEFSGALYAREKPLDEQVREAMLRATRFMVEEVSYNGGYVWNYLPDFSRQWGEMEAYPSMIWVEPPGTPSMGHLFLDAYHATGDEYYYEAAQEVAKALIWGQLESGGWNYIIDFEGEASLKKWYDTIGKNGWRLEEFHHYYGNATYDDDVTFLPAFLLLRMYNEKRDPIYLPPLEKAINLVLESQYPIGGWPQRYPLRYDFQKGGKPDYTSFITLNDDVHKNNVRFLIMCYQTLGGDSRLLEPIRRAMNTLLLLQYGPEQPGWSWQYTTDLEPAGARTYEPRGLYSCATYHAIDLMMDYYEISGETKFLARIQEAIDFLESIRLPREKQALYPRELRPGQELYPSCVQLGTNKPLYVHRRGSNVVNGEYYYDHNPENQWMPTFSMRARNVSLLQDRYDRLRQTPPQEVLKTSPLFSTSNNTLPEYVTGNVSRVGEEEVRRIIAMLDDKPYWEGVFADSYPYIGDGPEEIAEGDFSTTQVGDLYDTSPFRFGESVRGISTREYINNMFKLISYLALD